MKNKKHATKWISECIKYWGKRVYEGDLGVDFSEADKRCWRCGYERTLQKCHIVPKSLGGSDAPSNIIPLCAQCHDEAPDVNDPDEIFLWIKKNHHPFYDTYWLQRGIDESGVEFSSKKNDPEKFSELVRKGFNDIGVHFNQKIGGAYVKPSTYAWIFKKEVEGSLK